MIAPMTNPKRLKRTAATRDPEATKCEILDAATIEFAVGGLSAARTESIAAKTGVTKAMIYYYFHSKEELYMAVMERCFKEDLQLVQQLNLDQMSPPDALVTVVSNMYQKMCNRPEMTSILALEAIQNSGKYYPKQTAEVLFGQLIGLLDRGIASGDFRPLESRHTAIGIVGSCAFYFIARENIKHLWPGKDLLSPEMIDRQSKEATNMILAGVLAPGKSV
jgi:TetR/AcrR family transcriptional regulator